MAIKMDHQMRMVQTLKMTPQLQQAIKLLTLTHMEMSQEIAEALIENPALEEQDFEANVDKGNEDFLMNNLENSIKEDSIDNLEQSPLKKNDDFDWNSYVDSFESNTYTPRDFAVPDSEETLNYENIVSQGQSLADHLEWQLKMDRDLSPKHFAIAQMLIHNINDDGHLAVSLDEIIVESKSSKSEVLEIQEMVQRLDPIGCGSENLEECLLAQARILNEYSPLLETIIRNHMKDLQGQDYPRIAKETKVSIDAVKKIVEVIQNFHPRPGRLVAGQEVQYVVPDVYVIEAGTELLVKLNDEGVPTLRLSPKFQKMLQMLERNPDPKLKNYLKEKLGAAKWMINAIKSRQSTILKTAKAIVERQKDFFKKGIEYLKPMILKDIADEIGMHESTISRVTTNKFMHTPRGVFEMKYFFNAAVGGKDGGSDVTNEVVKLKIKQLIDKEPAKKPLSDQKIAEVLERDGINVARRTVAKYREMLGILPSSRRKNKN